MDKSKLTNNKGFSLIEMLVTVFVFAIVAVVATQSLANTLRSSTKTKSTLLVRENIDFALTTMERLLYNARSINCLNASKASRLEYVDEYGQSAYFACVTVTSDNIYIASNSADVKLTSPDIVVTNNNAGICEVFSNYSCPSDPPTPLDLPSSVTITLKAKAKGVSGSEGAEYGSSIRILLRNY